MYPSNASESPGSSVTPADSGPHAPSAHHAHDTAIDLALVVRDAEVVRYLRAFVDGDDRERAALAALRVGVLAISQATGSIDTQAIRGEGERLMAGVRRELDRHGEVVAGQIAGALRQYLDPTEGHLPTRLNEVLRPDGQLDQVLRRHVGADNSTIASALAVQLGQSSPVFKLLDPRQQDGLVATLRASIKEALDEQSKRVEGQFSLNDPASALSVFRDQLTKSNGQLRDDLARDVERVRKEFDLGNDQGALARLVQRVEEAQRRITGEFTLDNSASALSRLKSEVVALLESMRDRDAQFQKDIKAAVEVIRAVRAERQRNTAGGLDFEGAICSLAAAESARLGDLFEAVGARPGQVPRSKKGDAVITLGAETAAPGRKIVIEAKRQAKSLTDALEELSEAKRNREADVGIFVFAAASAGGQEGLEPFGRHGDDLVIVWDPLDASGDVYVKAAISVARALVVKRKVERDSATVDLAPVEAALDVLGKAADGIQEIVGSATLSISHGKKVLDRAERMKPDLMACVERLSECLARLRAGGLGPV
ncbi:MAG: hypothetical protein KF787_02070 [Phycisphaeraceae bacterium]|nr:hypothetical protein [Phycisphaerae bacterium]MBX3391411.1 hypothetical protein [Phycisphaeraceae bacterium]